MKTNLFRISIILIFLSFAVILPAQKKGFPEDRLSYVRSTMEHFQNNEWESGRKILEEGLTKYSRDSDLHMLLGKYYFHKKQYGNARFELLKALEYNKLNTSAKEILVNVEMETKRYSGAICYINELLEINPYWKDLWIKKVEAYRLQGNTVEANRLLKRLVQIYPEDKYIKSSYIYYIEEDMDSKKADGAVDEIIELATILINNNPSNVDAYLQLINTYLSLGDYYNALIICDKGLFYLPQSLTLIDKKTGILADQQRYNELFSFLDQKIKEGKNKSYLEKRYNYFLEEAARVRREADPYILYTKLYYRNPQNKDAFRYVVNMAISNGLYEDALNAIETAKKTNGETKEILLKEQDVYEHMGMESKANQIILKLYSLYPEDSDIYHAYSMYHYKQAKNYMQDHLWEKALECWFTVQEAEDPEIRRVALNAIANCYEELHRREDALLMLDYLIEFYGDTFEWYARKAIIYGQQREYLKAMQAYELFINHSQPSGGQRLLDDLDDLATIWIKELIENYNFPLAKQILEYWLTLNPQSEVATRYAINVTFAMKEYDEGTNFALEGLDQRPDHLHYKIKLAEGYNIQKKPRQSIEILKPIITDHPYHKELINAYSEAGILYADYLIKNKRAEESLEILEDALTYDPDNKELKYHKGIAYNKIHRNDSAAYYLSFSELNLTEKKDFNDYLKYVKYKSRQNSIGWMYNTYKKEDNTKLLTIAGVEYTRYAGKNNYTGRVNYSGKEEGKGIQGWMEWNHIWKPDFYSILEGGISNDYFPKIALNASAHKSFPQDWEVGLGVGYRWLSDKKNLISLTGGITKEWDQWMILPKVQSVILDSHWYYSIHTQARFQFRYPRNYLFALCSIGSSPDIEVLDYQLYNAFSVTNAMVGAGGSYLINDQFSFTVTGNWYNYKDNETTNRNIYCLSFQLNVNF